VGGEDWRARAWRLERLFPSEFGRQTKHQHTGPEGGPIGIDVGDALGDLRRPCPGTIATSAILRRAGGLRAPSLYRARLARVGAWAGLIDA
jgi:hypothetical protein